MAPTLSVFGTSVKHTLAAIACMLSVHAFAQSPAAVHRECVRQMVSGVCAAQLDKSTLPYGTGATWIVGSKRLPLDAYIDIRSLANPDDMTDTKMCDFALSKMLAEPGGAHDQVARELWPVAELSDEPNVSAVPMTDVVAAAVVAMMLVGVSFIAGRPRHGAA